MSPLRAVGMFAPPSDPLGSAISAIQEETIPDMERASVRPDGITHFLIIHDATDLRQDKAASTDSGLKRELVERAIQNGFAHTFLLTGIKYPFCRKTNVTCLGNSPAELALVIGAINSVLPHAPEALRNIDITYVQHGHGGGDDLEHRVGHIPMVDLAAELAKLPSATQRILIGIQCSAASMTAIPGLADNNDLLITFSGREKSEGNSKGAQSRGKTRVNVADAADLGLLYDADGTPAEPDSYQNMFWRGLIYSLVHTEFPLHRGAVYLPGINFEDRGFSPTNFPKPFPTGVVDIKVEDGIAGLVELLQHSFPKGITVVGYANQGDAVSVRRQYENLATAYPGWVQFVWVDEKTAATFLNSDADGRSTVFSLQYPGGHSSPLLSFADMENALRDVVHGVRTDR